MVTLESASNSNLPQTLPSKNNRNNHLRDASFSCYLNGAEESFVLKLAGSSQKLSPITTTLEDHIYLGKKKAGDGEIGVFDAERYFNGGMDEASPPKVAEKCARRYQVKEDEPVFLEPNKPNILSAGTPSVRSESSSNSQSALLQNILRNSARTKTNKLQGKSFFASLGCKCTCFDKDSVDIDEYAGEKKFNRSANFGGRHANGVAKQRIKTSLNPTDAAQITKPMSQSWVKEETSHNKFENFGVGDLNCLGNTNMPVKMQFQEVEQDEKLRKSLEVFGSPVWEKRNNSFSIEKRQSMLNWDANSRAEEIEIPSAITGNDTESDASSDLFEIESLTGRENPILSRQASDGMSGYAPSEASIEWSVITASAADFSVMSDCEEVRSASVITNPSKRFGTSATTAKAAMNKELPRRRPSTLLGCKSYRAVSVAGDAYRTSEKAIHDPRMQHRPESFMPVTRFQAEAKVSGFGSRHGQRACAARPHSSEGSHLLYIQ